jgi:hypothetical protein
VTASGYSPLLDPKYSAIRRHMAIFVSECF